jgi:outer membrane protein assembly factor BamB
VLYQGLLEPAKLQALDASSGRKLWEFPLPSEFRGGFAIANGAVYAGNGEPTSWGDLSLPYKHSMYCFTIDGK